MRPTFRSFSIFLSAAAWVSLSGCGILIGNTRPVEERSESYVVGDLAAVNPKWIRVKPIPKDQASSTDREETEVSDVTYHSTETESVIALNSSCRPSFGNPQHTLNLATQQLLMGMSHITERLEQSGDIAQTQGLETTIHGLISGRNFKMRVIVLKKGTCLYDLMYLSEPDQFPLHEKEFSYFVSSLRLK